MAKTTNIGRRGKAWTVAIRVNGSKVFRSFPNRDAAEVFLEQVKAERRAGIYRPPVKATFRDAAEAWYVHGSTIGGKRGPWKPTTKRDYRSVLDAHLIPEFGELQLGEVTAARIEQWQGSSIHLPCRRSWVRVPSSASIRASPQAGFSVGEAGRTSSGSCLTSALNVLVIEPGHAEVVLGTPAGEAPGMEVKLVNDVR